MRNLTPRLSAERQGVFRAASLRLVSVTAHCPGKGHRHNQQKHYIDRKGEDESRKRTTPTEAVHKLQRLKKASQ